METTRPPPDASRPRRPPSNSPGRPPRRPPYRRPAAVRNRRRLAVAGAALIVVIAGVTLLRSRVSPPAPEEVRGTPAWAAENFGNPDGRGFKNRNIVQIEFLGRAMFVHRGASRHFLRLARLFEARAPEYAAAVSLGELDDWSYENRDVRGGDSKSSHAFGIAVDVNALANPLGTAGGHTEDGLRTWVAAGGG